MTGRAGSNGFVTIDQLELLDNESNCPISPPDADPSLTTTTTTTTITTTTIDPDWTSCTFENGLCSWEIEQHTTESYFFWTRTTSEMLVNENIEGPIFDHSFNKNSEIH